MPFEFEDNSAEVIAAIQAALERGVELAAIEIQAQTKRDTPVRSGRLKGSWRRVLHKDGDEMVAYIGSDQENVYWNEFGTGIHAVNKDGRKGGWWIKVGNGENEIPLRTAKRYKWAKVRMDKKGRLEYVFTYGKPPQRTLQNAFIKKKNKAVNLIVNELRKL